MTATPQRLVATGTAGEVHAASLKLTVIIPVYNAMPFLTQTLDALLAQDIGIENFELIAIDDGSTDNGLETLVDYAERFPYARIYTQPNSGGPSQPRNFAMGLVETDYFFLHDADDWLSPEALRKMVDVAERNQTDIVSARMVGVGGRNVPTAAFRQTFELTDIWSSELYRLQNPMKMFRTSFVRENDLQFPEDMIRGEDRYFIMHAYFATNRQSLLADQEYIFFRYRDDGQNLTSRVNSFTHKFLAVKTAVELLEELVPQDKNIDELMLRHLRVEVGGAFIGPFDSEQDEDLKREGFEWLVRVAHRYEHLITSRTLHPPSRAMLHIARYGTYEDAVVYASDFCKVTKHGYSYHIDEDGTYYLVGPRFRTGKDALPDSVYLVSPRYFFNPNITEIKGNVLYIHAQTLLSEAWFDENPQIRVFLTGRGLPKGGVDIGEEALIISKEINGSYSTTLELTVILKDQLTDVPPGSYSVKIALREFKVGLALYGNLTGDEDGVLGVLASPAGTYTLRKNAKNYLRIEVFGQKTVMNSLKAFLRSIVRKLRGRGLR